MRYDRSNPPDGDRIIRQLTKLVDDNYKQERNAPFYLEKIGLSLSWTNKITDYYYGKTLKELLRDRLVLEAKILLSTTDLSLKAIADELMMRDQATLSVFFKMMTGERPRMYRVKSKPTEKATLSVQVLPKPLSFSTN